MICTERLVLRQWREDDGEPFAALNADPVVAKDELGLDEVISFTSTTNLRSQRVMQRIGMTHDPADDFDHPRVKDPRLRRHVLYRLAFST